MATDLDKIAYATALERLRRETGRFAESLVLAAAAAQHVDDDDARADAVFAECHARLRAALLAAPGFAVMFERGD